MNSTASVSVSVSVSVLVSITSYFTHLIHIIVCLDWPHQRFGLARKPNSGVGLHHFKLWHFTCLFGVFDSILYFGSNKAEI